ncbi:FH2 domain-containing protein 1-like isoform X2 [Cheilinus undulatus]|uniref:FH2 domain-containing protein 1-like isoform X2 n=1 Tax=Cheilinus undulatus TaxID=241271 RepID=UPI001BD56644|nr:FH2 domain-containing protein 1-like isoform X2 [Cheilinus undulatus]
MPRPRPPGEGRPGAPSGKPKRRSNQMIVDDIQHGNSEVFGAEPLRELLKLLPETDEVEKLKRYRGDISKLSLADSFVYLLIQLPSYSVRIESMLLKEEFPGACEAMKRDLKILRSATKELMYCEELHAVLHLVLQAGNILNAGGYAGNAVGFKLSSLLSLADTKANKPGMNLLHFVALEAQKKDNRLLEFPLKLSHVQPAARISLETLDTDLQWLTSRTHAVEENVQRDTELLQQLDDFLQSATSSLCSLRYSRQQLKKEGSELIDFFCEDRETFRLDDCFSIFHTFCSRFTDAVKENMEREAKEAARRRRIQELEEQKRHSWAGGEEVGGAFGLRCSSETDMSVAMSRHSEAGLLVELLTRPRSPNTLGHSGSLRRSRNSPSTSPSIAAERELSTLLMMGTTDNKVTQQRAFQSASPDVTSPGLSPKLRPHSPRLRTSSFPQNQQPQVQTSSSPPKIILSANHATASYLSNNATPPRLNTINPITNNTVTPTSDANQQSYSKDGLCSSLSGQGSPPDHRTRSGLRGDLGRNRKDDQDITGPLTSGDKKFQSSMSVVVEKCMLVPELKVFEKVTSKNDKPSTSHLQEDLVVTDLEVEDKSKVEKAQNDLKIAEESDMQREEEDREEDKVMVWCVTSVCEAASELSNTDKHTETERDQHRSDNQGGGQQASSSPANGMPLKPQLANEKQVPEPISSQPVPVSRCDNPSLQDTSPRWRPAESPSASELPALTIDACEKVEEPANQASPDDERESETVQDASLEDESRSESGSCHATNEETEVELSAKDKAQQSSKQSTKNPSTSKSQSGGSKPAANSLTNKYKPVRTLTNSENQGMRRVVPISRTSRSTPSQGKRPEKPGTQQGSASAAAPAGLKVSNVNSASVKRGERPLTAPSSRRSSIPKDPKEQKVPGIQASSREQSQDLQRKPSIRKPVAKPKPQPEEKICRSTLRALAQGGGGSVSAPATPMHKAGTSSSALPSFARSTASSSFRRTHSTFTPPAPPHSSHSGSDASPKPSPKTTSFSTVTLPGTSSPFTRTGSLRVSTTPKPSDPPNSSTSSPLTRSQSIRMTHRSSPHDSLIPPRGHRRNDSGTFSDKSSHSRDSSKSTRPNWR